MSSDDRDPAGPTTVADGVVPSPAERVAAARQKHQRGGLPVWQESLLLLGLAVVLAVLLKTFVVQAFYIPSESMEPGLVEDDRILVEKWSGWFGGEVERGDVVVFEDPGGWLNAGEVEEPGNPVSSTLAAIGLMPDTGYLVKRVVGVEGDVIECCDSEKRLTVNGVALDEDDYVLEDQRVRGCRGPMTGNCSWKAGPVPKGSVFVMGDNRGRSADSTVHMCLEDETDCVPGDEFVPTDLVVGKVWLLLWPTDRFGRPDEVDAFDDVPDAP
ncbi:Signal peptidase I [Nocardioides dokdonensis FR1436]|uniref:Signal peptidase I n=1 Tax=Nocardioides dokdonensis FR1436 TaxID=1300347 RepID=A0A1A9GKX3_9ACTN|nr:signal peptidase I [Nocardioides dokdonensis]ANH38949.1 Signal peptidase I [Nocardioides dokdonensis FR1436]